MGLRGWGLRAPWDWDATVTQEYLWLSLLGESTQATSDDPQFWGASGLGLTA